MDLSVIENGDYGGETGMLEEVDEQLLGVCSNVDNSQIYHRENFCDGRMSLALMIAMLVLGFITVFINLGVIIRTVKVLRNSNTKKPSFFFIGNLALSDLAIGLYVVIAFLLHITRKSDLWQNSTCMVQIAVAVTACQETIFTITLIAVDKYLYICYGLHYSVIVTTKRVYMALGLTWVLSLLIGTLPAMGMRMTWAEACSRCIFAQVVSPDFTIIFFVTSVAVPYLVIVSLYTVLLILALKMQKAKYGGSYKSDSSSRPSNFRLSFMSTTTKSGRSSSKTTISSMSSNSSGAHKATRRKTRKMEMEAYKATLPGLSMKKEDAKLIGYKSDEKGEQRLEEIKEFSETTEGFVETAKEVQDRGEAMDEYKHTTPPYHKSEDQDSDSCEEESTHTVESITKEDDSDIHLPDSTNLSETETAVDAGDNKTVLAPTILQEETEQGDISSAKSDLEGNAKAIRYGKRAVRQVKISFSEKNTGDDHTTAADGDVSNDAQRTSSNTNSSPPKPTKQTDKLAQSNTAPQKESCWSNTDDEASEVDLESSQETVAPTPPSTWHSWFPSEYLNHVVTDTKDKVLFLKKCRAVKTVGLIIISFTATYVPFVVGSLIYANEQGKRVCLLHMLNTLLYCAVVANSIANPLIYAYGYSEFRLKTKKFKGIFARERTRKL